MDTEILVYRVVGLAFLVCLPVALAFIILPRTNRAKKAYPMGCCGVYRTWLRLGVGMRRTWRVRE